MSKKREVKGETVKKKSTAKADINFEDKLWNVANNLRGAVAENQYKDYVLSLLFVKHLSERFETRRKELTLALDNPKSDYYTQNKKERTYVLEDELEYASKNVYRLPKEATWTYFLENAEQDDIKVKVDNAFIIIDDILSSRDPDHKGLLPPMFVKSQLTPKQVAGLINLFSSAEFSEASNEGTDLYGRIYEYYIGKFAQAEGSGAGQFFTPSSIVRLIVEMIEPMSGRIADFALGSAGMMVQSVKFLKAHSNKPDDYMIYGQERYEGTLRLAKMNLLLRNMNFKVKLGDSLLDDKLSELTGKNGADYVIMNPPFNLKFPNDLLSESDARLFGPKETFTTSGNANYMWFQTIWHHLSPKGTAGVVMANGAMTSGTAGEKNVREYMIEKGMVDCIVQLPDRLFLTTGIPACIFILSKNRDGKDGFHRERKNEILFIDARKLGTMVTRKVRAFADEDIESIANVYHQWRNIKGKYKNHEGFCFSSTLEDVKNQNMILSPGRYVGTEEEAIDGILFEDRFKQLSEKLQQQFANSDELKIKILKEISGLL